jgi:4-azaleucine resistance transporter AzlC
LALPQPAAHEDIFMPAVNSSLTTSTTTPRAGFCEGFLASLPLGLSFAPFAVAFALAARAAGLGAAETVAMSLLVNAGASQFTAAALFAGGADGLSIVLATLVVNLRHIPFAISLAPLVANLRWFERAVLAFGLSDPTYAMSVRRLEAGEAGPAFLVGSGASLYVCWVLCTVAGLLIGGVIADPSSVGLQLVFPLSLLALLVPFLRSRAAWAAVLVGGGLALGIRLVLPGNWYILIAAIGGGLVGALLEARR